MSATCKGRISSRTPGPIRRDAKAGRQDGVHCGLQALAVESEVERLKSERGDRCIAAEKPDERQIAKRLLAECAAPRTSQPGERTDDQGTRDVHDQRSPGKGFTDPASDKARDKKARDASEETSEQYEGAGFECHDNEFPQVWREDGINGPAPFRPVAQAGSYERGPPRAPPLARCSRQ